MGVELTGKTLGLIGCGNIGSIVADRASGLRMKVVAYDPYLTEKRAIELGVEKVDLDTIFPWCSQFRVPGKIEAEKHH